jgi:glycosyltransferase involved in cell wall biosynthesis
VNIVLLTPGAGGMYCGACMRDNALASALRKLGHDALLLPLYTPLTTDEPDNSYDRIFFGGINVFLQQKSAVFRKTPEWMDNRLDNKALLRMALGIGVKTEPKELGELTISMLKGEDGFQAKELNKLTAWMSEHVKPDVICLSNALLCGMTHRLRETLKTPIICTLQGEDYFLDGLPEAQRAEAWSLLQKRAADVDAFIGVSRYYGDTMRARLNLPAEKVHAIYNGIDLSGYGPKAPADAPTIGFLSRMAPEKGLRTLVRAFKMVREKIPAAKLHIAGSKTAGDEAFVNEVTAEIKRDNLHPHITFSPNVDRAGKIAFLQSLSVLSVPAEYGESFGLYVVEALACGVPVVQPRHGAFPELIEATGGGILYEPGKVEELAAKLCELLGDSARRKEHGEKGRTAVLEQFSLERMAKDVAALFERVRQK